MNIFGFNKVWNLFDNNWYEENSLFFIARICDKKWDINKAGFSSRKSRF